MVPIVVTEIRDVNRVLKFMGLLIGSFTGKKLCSTYSGERARTAFCHLTQKGVDFKSVVGGCSLVAEIERFCPNRVPSMR